MKQYIVKPGQNIYDISVLLYGSIEGVFDILVNNDIGINDTLTAGTVINYDEEFIINEGIQKWLEENNILPANGDVNFDVSEIVDLQPRIIVDQEGPTSLIEVTLSSGTMYIDWGDGQNIDKLTGISAKMFDHPYNDDGKHVIRFYGNFALRNFDIREINGTYYALSQCHVSGSFKESTGRSDLKTLFL